MGILANVSEIQPHVQVMFRNRRLLIKAIYLLLLFFTNHVHISQDSAYHSKTKKENRYHSGVLLIY